MEMSYERDEVGET